MEQPKKFNKNILYIFIGNFITSLICYGMFLQKHFSVDSYAIIYDNAGYQYLMQGRIVSYLLNLCLNKFGINPTLDQQFFSFVLIFSISICSTVLIFILNKTLKNKISINIFIISLLVNISFLNVFLLEWFLYPEITLFLSVGLIFTILSIWAISENDRKVNLFASFIFMMISMEIYQANLGIFIIYALTICFIKNNGILNKKSICNSMKILIIGGLTSIINMIILKAMMLIGIAVKGDREPKLNIEIILQNLSGILKVQKEVWFNSYNFLPKFFILIFMIFMVGIGLYSIRKRNCIKKKNILYFIILVLINYCIVFVPHVFTSNLWLAQRTIVSFFSFLSFLGLILLWYNKNNFNIQKILLGLTVVFLVVNIVYIQFIGANHIASNRMDEEFSIIINNEIEKYEQESGIEVKNIAIKNDTNPTYHYPNIKYCIFDTNIRAFITDWANVNMINYYTNSNYKKIYMDEDVYNANFKNKNWDNLNIKEQFVFKGDTLFLIVY